MAETIRVLLVDDQRLMRDGIRMLLELEADFDVIAEAENGEEAVAAYDEHLPDVVLMDIRMPLLNGVEATKTIRAKHSKARILVLTTFDEDKFVFEAIRAGAMGYLLKDLSGEELATAIRTIAAGGALMGPEVAERVMRQLMMGGGETAVSHPTLTDPLTDRELEILQLMAQGNSNAEIAKTLFLAEGTVKNYVSSILQKTAARDRTQAVLHAQKIGLI